MRSEVGLIVHLKNIEKVEKFEKGLIKKRKDEMEKIDVNDEKKYTCVAKFLVNRLKGLNIV